MYTNHGCSRAPFFGALSAAPWTSNDSQSAFGGLCVALSVKAPEWGLTGSTHDGLFMRFELPSLFGIAEWAQKNGLPLLSSGRGGGNYDPPLEISNQ